MKILTCVGNVQHSDAYARSKDTPVCRSLDGRSACHKSNRSESITTRQMFIRGDTVTERVATATDRLSCQLVAGVPRCSDHGVITVPGVGTGESSSGSGPLHVHVPLRPSAVLTVPSATSPLISPLNFATFAPPFSR